VEEFLLLGQIPGTNLVITFWQWAIILGCLFGMVMVWRQLRHNKHVQRKIAQTKALMAKRVDPTTLDQAAL
jgi:hypothetical protein